MNKKIEDMTFSERNREIEKLLKLINENLSFQKELVKQYEAKIIELEGHINNQKILYNEYKELMQEKKE